MHWSLRAQWFLGYRYGTFANVCGQSYGPATSASLLINLVATPILISWKEKPMPSSPFLLYLRTWEVQPAAHLSHSKRDSILKIRLQMFFRLILFAPLKYRVKINQTCFKIRSLKIVVHAKLPEWVRFQKQQTSNQLPSIFHLLSDPWHDSINKSLLPKLEKHFWKHLAKLLLFQSKPDRWAILSDWNSCEGLEEV